MKLAILGTGAAAQIHAAAFTNIQGVDLVGMVGRDEERTKKITKRFNTQPFTDPFDVLDDPAVDAISVCYPTHLHKEYSIEALNRGKQVFCEVPIARTLEDAEKMVDAANKSDSLLLIALLDRFVPEFLYIRDTIESGELGKVLSIADYKIHPPYWEYEGSLKNTIYVDPLIIEVLHFDLDYLNWLFGLPKVVNAAGVRGQTETYEHIFAFLEFENILGSVEGNVMVTKSFPISSGIRVLFEKAAVETITRIVKDGPPEVKVILYPAEGKAEEIQLASYDPYQKECEYFVNCVKGEADPSLLSAEAARDALRVSWAIRESLKTNSPTVLRKQSENLKE